MTMYDPAKDYATAVLVTGATGAIGSAVCRELVTHGYRVLGLIHTPEAKSRLSYGVVAVHGDIRDPAPWESAIERADVDRSPRRAHRDRRAGRRSARTRSAMRTSWPQSWINFAGTSAATRSASFIPSDRFSTSPARTDGCGRPARSARVAATGSATARPIPVLTRHRKKGLRAMSVNPAFVYGQGGWFEGGVLEPMSRGQSSYIGEGTQNMHYVEAADAAVAYRLAIERGLDGEDYLIADDQPSTIGEFTRLVAREVGAPAPKPVPEEDLIPILGDWCVEAYTFCPKVDSTKAREQLGWAPRYKTIEQGVPHVVREWRQAHAAA